MNAHAWRVALALLPLAPGGALPASSADRFGEVRDYIRTQLVERSVPSVAVAVAKDGKIIWEEGFGWADRERRIPASEHTVYSLASISKPITATGVMTLVQAGKIDLDKPANDYLGNARLLARVGDARQATVRRLANHTSGLPLHFQDYFADQPARRPSTDVTILRYGNLVRAPGERTQYSNLGFGVLDYIIERVSGAGYAQFMLEQVFLPLGMTRTSVGVGPGLADYVATRYDRSGLPLPYSESDTLGASAVFSSAHDLARFALFHLKTHLPDQKAILSDASIDEMQRRTAAKNVYGIKNDQRGFGVGFDIDAANERYPVVQHDGGMDGVATQLKLFPRQHLAVVVLSNASTQLPVDVTERIVATVLPDYKPYVPPKPAALVPFVADPHLLGTWQGTIATYANNVPVELQFLANGEVRAKLGDQLAALIDKPHFEQGVFTGWLSSRIDTPDTARYSYNIWLDLSLRGDVINGAATALTDRKGPRMGSSLTYWLEVEKQPR